MFTLGMSHHWDLVVCIIGASDLGELGVNSTQLTQFFTSAVGQMLAKQSPGCWTEDYLINQDNYKKNSLPTKLLLSNQKLCMINFGKG